MNYLKILLLPIILGLWILIIWVCSAFAKTNDVAWSVRGNFQYLHLKMNEYQIYKKIWGDNNLNDFNNGFGGQIEILRQLPLRLRIGLSIGVIYGRMNSNWESSFQELLTKVGYRISLSTFPMDLNLYFDLLREKKFTLYYGNGIGFWRSRLTFAIKENYEAQEQYGFEYQEAKLHSNNISFHFRLGFEYRFLQRFGFESSIYYRIAEFYGFKGIASNNVKAFERGTGNIIYEGTSQYDAQLIYDIGNDYWGFGKSPLNENKSKGSVNMGNWGLSAGLIWYFR